MEEERLARVRVIFGEMVGLKGNSLDRRRIGRGASRRTSRHSASGRKGGARQHRRPTDGSDWPRTGRRLTYGNYMTPKGAMTAKRHATAVAATATRTADTNAPRRGGGSEGGGRGDGGGLPKRPQTGYGRHRHDACLSSTNEDSVSPPGLARILYAFPACFSLSACFFYVSFSFSFSFLFFFLSFPSFFFTLHHSFPLLWFFLGPVLTRRKQEYK